MIHKQHLDIVESQRITIPWNANIVSVASQKGELYVWYYFALEPFTTSKEVEIRIVGTGNAGPDVTGGKFLGTCVMEYGLVWHVFEMPCPEDGEANQ